MSYYSDTKRNFAIVAIALILVAVLLCGIMTEGFREWNPYCWFGHEYGEDGICTKCGAQAPANEELEDDGGLAMNGEKYERGMRLTAVKISRPQFSEEGIEPLAESAQQLTATITPADATNKEVDWKIEWVNASSTWANGKTVTDYVTIAPTSDGALTANLTCLQAFAEQIVVTVSVRTDPGIYATALVDYEKRVLGLDFSIVENWNATSETSPLSWNMTTSDLNTVIDFPMMHNVGQVVNMSFEYVWGLAHGGKDGSDITITPHYSIYTKNKSYAGVQVCAAPTAAYIDALEAAGLTVNANAGEYVLIGASATTPDFAILTLLMNEFCEDSLSSFDQYVALRTALRNNIGSVMLQVKVELLGGDDRDNVTIYNVKFSEASVTPIAESITVTPDNIEF